MFDRFFNKYFWANLTNVIVNVMQCKKQEEHINALTLKKIVDITFDRYLIMIKHNFRKTPATDFKNYNINFN